MICTTGRSATTERNTEHKAELVPFLQGILETTTFKGGAAVSTDSKVLFTLHTTRISSKTVEKFRRTAESFAASTDNPDPTSLVFISPKGRLLASAGFGTPSRLPAEKIAVIAKSSKPSDLAKILKESGASKLVIRDGKQLSEALKLRGALGIEAIYAPQKLIEKLGQAAPNVASLLKALPAKQPGKLPQDNTLGLSEQHALTTDWWKGLKVPEIQKGEITFALPGTTPRSQQMGLPAERSAIAIRIEAAAPVIQTEALEGAVAAPIVSTGTVDPLLTRLIRDIKRAAMEAEASQREPSHALASMHAFINNNFPEAVTAQHDRIANPHTTTDPDDALAHIKDLRDAYHSDAMGRREARGALAA